MHIGRIALVQIEILKGINGSIIYDLVGINLADPVVIKGFSTLLLNILRKNGL